MSTSLIIDLHKIGVTLDPRLVKREASKLEVKRAMAFSQENNNEVIEITYDLNELNQIID